LNQAQAGANIFTPEEQRIYLRVFNDSKKTDAQNVQAKLIKISPNPEALNVNYRCNLSPQNNAERTINPKDYLAFFICSVERTHGGPSTQGQGRFFCEFVEGGATFMELNTEYQIEISVSANNRGCDIHIFSLHCDAANMVTIRQHEPQRS
jgi:hypothetical protein